MRQDSVLPSWPDFRAVATKYHTGQISAQLRIHKASLLHAKIISAVVVTARRNAELREIRGFRNLWRTPKIAGKRKRNGQSLGRNSKGKAAKQNTQGNTQKAALTHRVRRESAPTTKPPAQDQAISRIMWQRSSKKPSWPVGQHGANLW